MRTTISALAPTGITRILSELAVTLAFGFIVGAGASAQQASDGAAASQ